MTGHLWTFAYPGSTVHLDVVMAKESVRDAIVVSETMNIGKDLLPESIKYQGIVVIEKGIKEHQT